MQISITSALATFRSGDRIAGEYVLNDPYKPHFRTLLTPAGHNTVVVSPGDHRHHKGLMYGLRCADINFWEEDPGTGTCGIQEILQTEVIENGIRQQLLWREFDGKLATYRETREITCSLLGTDTFHWHWKTHREALRDHVLIKSQWSMPVPDGRLINYHGLGVRLPWVWRFPGDHVGRVELNGKSIAPMEACGSTAREVGFWGMVDGQWQRTIASVTFRQHHNFTWFVLKNDFAYLSVGPSNADPVTVAVGDIHEEHYEVLVADRPSNFCSQ